MTQKENPTPDPAGNIAQGSSAKVCGDCVTDRPTPHGQGSTGEIIKLDGIDTYISKPADYPHQSARLLLLLTSGTGVNSVNNQIQADRFAAEGFVVVMPDLFDGDPAPNQAQEEPNDIPLIGKIKMKLADAAKGFMIDMWLSRHTEDKVLPILHKVLAACNDSFSDAVGNGVYAVGYCFGGRYVLLLAAEKEVPAGAGQTDSQGGAEGGDKSNTTARPFIKAGALAHATMVNPKDFHGLVAPLSLVCVEDDALFPDSTRKAGEEYMSKNNIEHEVQVYPGVPHGFAVVGEYQDENIKKAQEEAHEQMLVWIQDH